MENQKPISMGPCYHCKEPMWATQATKDTYLRNNQTFYCVHGHAQCYAKGKSETQKLQEQLDAERLARQRAEQRIAYKDDQVREARERAEKERHRANGYKGHATKMTKRVKAGVCPCCNRTFKQLAAHMANKHPQFTPLEIEEGTSLQ
jgi:chromosome segregation ATPase